MDIYVGSLPFKMKEAELKLLFEHYGQVSSVTIIIDKITRQNKGFGFVVMPNEEEANKAIEHLDNFGVGERKLIVNKSERKDEGEGRSTRGNHSQQTDRFQKSKKEGERGFKFFGNTGKKKWDEKGPGKSGFKKPGGPRKGRD